MRRTRLGRGLATMLAVGAVASAAILVGASPAAAATTEPKVAILASDLPDWTADVSSKLTASGDFDSVTTLPESATHGATPTLADLQKYDVVFVWTDDNFTDPDAVGDVLADYVDGGGRVVIAAFSTLSNNNLGGRFDSGDYLPTGLGEEPVASVQTLQADLPDDPLLAGVTSFESGSSSYHAYDVSVKDGSTLVAHWSDGSPLVVTRGNVVELNFWPVSSDAVSASWNSATDGTQLMVNALTSGFQPKTIQTISFAAPSAITYGDTGPTLGASASSGLTVTYAATGPCSVDSDGQVTVTGAGSCVITASQAGNDTYAAADSVTQTLVIKTAPTLALTADPTAGSTVGQSVTLTATLSGAGADATGTVAFTVGGTNITDCETKSLSTADGATTATCTTTALPSGSDTLAAVYTGDDNNAGATAPDVTYPVTAAPTGGGAGGGGTTPPATCAPFTDVTAANQFCDDIAWAKNHTIATGNTDGSFAPTASVVRQAMAGFLYRYEHPNTTAAACTTKPFTDVATSNVFCADIAALKAEGVIAGNGDGTFSPATAVSRQTTAAFLYRIANPGKTAAACTTAPFQDVAVSNVFCGDISYLVGQKVTGGYPDGGYHPATVVARQEMAAFLHRLNTTSH